MAGWKTAMHPTLDFERGDTPDTLLERLTETIAWCQTRVNVADPRNCFRSRELLPHPLEDGRKRVVASVAYKRWLALGGAAKRPAANLAGGRLLIYKPDWNLAHGLEEAETKGFLDIDNTPPWDTWLGYVYEPAENYLLSWVPGDFVSLVSAGIDVSPEQCFQWLDREDLHLASMFKKWHLI
jgi:hypothetical protein